MRMILSFLHNLGGLAVFYGKVFRALLKTQGNFKPITDQMFSVYTRSFSTVVMAGVFVGAILALQFNSMLSQYNAQVMLGGLNTSSCVREVGPLIISFLLAGKIGAYTAAELGTMRVTEQIDAIECLGTDSIQYLVVPRFIAIILSSVLLLIVGLIVSTAGAMVVAKILCGVNYLQFLSSVPRFAGIGVLGSGMLKALVYGTIVAGVACHRGYTAKGGARGVGRAVTQAAIFTNFYIVLANWGISFMTDMLSKLFFIPGVM